MMGAPVPSSDAFSNPLIASSCLTNLILPEK
jgi:hypothetical protein